MLSGRTVDQFCNPVVRQRAKVETWMLATKGAATVLSNLPVCWGGGFGRLFFRESLAVIHLSGPKIQAMPRLGPSMA